MKNFFVITVAFLFCGVVNAQLYSFDKKCIEKSTRIKPKLDNEIYRESWVYLNTEDSTYYMIEGPNSSYFLIDNPNAENTIIQYSVVNAKPVYSVLEVEKTDFSYSEKEIQKITVEKNADGNFLVKTFPKKEGKRSNLEVAFTLKSSTIPLRQIRFMDLSPSIHRSVYEALLRELDHPNYQIEKVQVDYRNGYHFLYDFTQCENVRWALRFKD